MKKTLFEFMAILAVAGLVLSACAPQPAPKVKLVFASDATWPPMELVNDKKEIVGFDIDLINEIARAGGFEVEVKNTAWDGIFAGLAFEDLISGRLAAVVCDTPTAALYVLQNDKYKGKLIVAGQIATDEFYGIAVKKGKADALKLINEGLKKAKESGKLDELKKKWIL